MEGVKWFLKKENDGWRKGCWRLYEELLNWERVEKSGKKMKEEKEKGNKEKRKKGLRLLKVGM
jgi:hypothetical protein